MLLPTPSTQQQPGILYVNNSDPTCQGLTPCYGTIQAAVDAAQAGDTIRIQAGTYVEQVNIQGKNNVTGADELDRIVIEADPALPPGSVVLQGAVSQCTNGHAIRLQQSKFITIRGLTITAAGGQAISLLGGNNQNQAIHLDRNRIFGNGSPECSGGITIARGNPDTLIVNNLIYANGRNGITFIDADGGPHHLIENTIHANHWNGLRVARSHVVYLVNNLITGNGTATGSTGGRYGVSREGSTSPEPEGIHLLHNLVCGNRLGEIDGPALDPTDANNLTPTGSEGSGVLASAGCDLPATVYATLNGPDGLPNTADDDFTLAAGSPAIDHGLDPRTLGLNPLFNPLFEADFKGHARRPRDGNGDGVIAFDLGALEGAAGEQVAPLTISITEPADGTTVPAGPLLVRGTLQVRDAGTEVGVSVNGFVAFVTGTQWAAEVPLEPGSNVLSATAVSTAGDQVTTSITVTTSQATQVPLILRALPDNGIAPLRVTWQVTNQTGRSLVQFEFDETGAGTFSPPTATFEGVQTTYTVPGTLFPTLRATDDQGTVHLARTLVHIEDPQTATARFQGLWSNLKARLQAGDIPAALAHLAPTLRPRFQAVFQQLGADLPAIAASLGNIQVLEQVGDLAEAAIVQQENGVPFLYFIYFRRDGLGRWLIEEM